MRRSIGALLFHGLMLGSAAAGPFYVDPTDAPYNAACAIGTDDTVALQAALDDAATHKLSLFLPRSCYFGTELHVNAVSIFGAGAGRLVMTNPTQRGLVVTSGTPSGGGAVVFRDFAITSGTVPTAGAAITVDPGGDNVNTGSRFENISIPVAYDGIDFVRAAFWTVRDPHIGEPTLQSASKVIHRGITVRNVVQEDYGDSLITGGLIAAGPGSAENVYMESSAGLKIIGTKMVGDAQNCFHLSQVSNRAMGLLIIEGNSLEGCTVNGMLLEQSVASVAHGINGLVIVGNQIGGGAGSGFVGINVVGKGATWIMNATINGNAVMANQTASMGGIVLDGIWNATVTGNAVFNNSSNPTGYAYIAGAWMREGYIGKNTVGNLPATMTACVISGLAAGNPGPQIRYEAATPCF